MAGTVPETIAANQLVIRFPPENMPTGIAQAVVEESRKGDGLSVVVTGAWEAIRAKKHAQEILDDIADRRHTGLELVDR